MTRRWNDFFIGLVIWVVGVLFGGIAYAMYSYINAALGILFSLASAIVLGLLGWFVHLLHTKKPDGEWDSYLDWEV